VYLTVEPPGVSPALLELVGVLDAAFELAADEPLELLPHADRASTAAVQSTTAVHAAADRRGRGSSPASPDVIDLMSLICAPPLTLFQVRMCFK
jgi:hypothetical protein